jgi:hypothetical protein
MGRRLQRMRAHVSNYHNNFSRLCLSRTVKPKVSGGNPLKIPPHLFISHPFFSLFFGSRGGCRNKLPPPPGFADVSKVRGGTK